MFHALLLAAAVFRGDPALTGVTTNALPSQLALRWTFKTGDSIKSSPVICGERVFIGSDDGKLYALSLKTGGLAWSFTTSNAVEAAPLVLDGAVFIGSTDDNLYALNAATGALKWKYATDAKIPGAANYFRTGNAARILVGSHDNKLHCLDAATGKPVWTFDTSNYINGAPAVGDGKIVFGGCDGLLHVLDFAGKELAAIEAGAYVPGSAAIAGGQAFAGHYGSEVICADLTRTNVLWQYKGRDAFFSSPAVTDKLVVIGGRDKRLHCLDRATGKLLWAFQTRDEVDCSPVVSGDKVIFGSGDGRLYLVSLADGKQLWSYDIGKPITGSPAIAGGLVVIGAEDGVVYAFGEKRGR